MHVREPWFTEIESGRKTIEGRAGPLSKHQPLIGKEVIMYNESVQIIVKVLSITHYDSIHEYFNNELLTEYAPHLNSIQEARKAYAEFGYTADYIERVGGINAIRITL